MGDFVQSACRIVQTAKNFVRFEAPFEQILPTNECHRVDHADRIIDYLGWNRGINHPWPLGN